MRSTFFLGLLTAGLIAAVAPGCSDGGDDNTGGNGGAGGGTGGSGAGTNTGGAGGTGGSSDNNNSFEEAQEIAIDGDVVTAELDPVDSDVDYYRFNGTKGQAISILTAAKPSLPGDPFDPAYPDLVITLFNANQEQIAENDDPLVRNTNDPHLMTILPDDGVYYIRVTECNAWFSLNGATPACSPTSEIINFEYRLLVTEMDPSLESVVQDTEPNNDTATANPLEYALTDSGDAYYITQVYGTFSDDMDVDVYSFSLPADPPITEGRLTGSFEVYPHGPTENGSTTPIGEFTIVNSNGDVIAQIDASLGGELSPPLDPGVEYFLYVKHPGSPAGSNDFYFINHVRGGSNPVETKEADNNAPLTPEELTGVANRSGGQSFFVDGTLDDGNPQDVDYFSIAVPQEGIDNGWRLSVACGAQRLGSGVRGLKVEVLNGNGAGLGASYTRTEAADTDLLISNQALPATVAAGKLLVRVSADVGDGTVLSRFYRCGVHLSPVQN
ncbi:PPC domain-containing protein [Chondromyces crocatus]|uniref:Peptidase C-terminal archaeal/bacterial domain-containing protein n=1 Tax=Chondromyces crocatus TaxID=52 RepID=A0A0K1ELZ7_CHOCO|nr:PPC domain-containing protein [Chondromyces crocatus]AKT41687.1 uncharacterized protein CMC5_058960 [Chondromyces crocatus]